MKKINVNLGWNDDPTFLPPLKQGFKIFLSILLSLVAGGVAYYFLLPALNFKDIKFYILIFIILLAYIVFTYITANAFIKPEYTPYVKKQSRIPVIIGAVFLAVIVCGLVASSVVVRAKAYSKILEIDETKSFAIDVEEIDFQSVPVLDSSSAKALADKKIGELSEVVSQYDVADIYTQINLRDRPVRATTLKYGDFFKWLKNRSSGLPAYIVVDMVSQKVDVVSLPEGQGMKYSTSEYFNNYLPRYLRFHYPTYLFDTPTFEINEDGEPYWICSRLDNTIGLFGGTDAIGAVLVNAVTGEHTYYDIDTLVNDKNLQWIDRIYSSDMLIEQFDYYGEYQKGFINSIIIQQDVRSSTEGYNYLALNDDVYLYTGVTSVNKDESIIGFVLINQRSKEATFYKVAGGKELSAMSSAQGAVQEYGFNASFPLLLNVSGQPTYFMALKDSSNYVKMYAMVNVDQIQIVSVGYSLAECTEKYAKLLESKGISVDIDIDDIPDETTPSEKPDDKPAKTASGKIAEIRTAVKGGESVYYIKLAEHPAYFAVSASDSETVVILNVGDTITITAKSLDGEIVQASTVKRTAAQ